jgi:excisionase family DNA binding protein
LRLLTIRQVSKELAVSYGYAYLLIKEGKIKSVKVGKAIRIQPDALDEYLGKTPIDTGYCLRQGLKTTLEDVALEIIRQYLADRFEAFEEISVWNGFAKK